MLLDAFDRQAKEREAKFVKYTLMTPVQDKFIVIYFILEIRSMYDECPFFNKEAEA